MNAAHPSRMLLPTLGLFALASLLFAVLSGSQSIALADLLSNAATPTAKLAQTLAFELRLPRALSAFAVGGLLALAGVLMQILLRNPLADPYVLGVSGGAAFAVLLTMLFGLPSATQPVAAFSGALLSMLTVFVLAHWDGPQADTRLLLTGVIMASGWAALVSLLLSLSPSARLPGMLFWLMGDLSDADAPALPLSILAFGVLIAFSLARPLDLLRRGQAQASALGVSIGPLQISVFLLGSLLTAAAVTLAGSIGFIGLLVPHMFRLIGGAGHRQLVPGAALLGGALLVLADTLARTVAAPQQLPVGVITALLGVPVFLYLLNRGQRET
jgi:iron complex transport system permease protein